MPSGMLQERGTHRHRQKKSSNELSCRQTGLRRKPRKGFLPGHLIKAMKRVVQESNHLLLGDIKKFEEKVLFSQDDGWTTIDLSKEGDPYPILLRMRNPIEILKELLAFPANSEGFACGPRRTEDAQGRRTVSDPETATWWEEAQPTSMQSFEPNSPEFTLRGLQVFQQCLGRFLQPLKDASFDGFVAEDPDGGDKFFYPLLYAYICDHPEGCKVTCTKDGNQTNAPCSICMCPANELHEVGQRYYYRTPEGMRWGVNQIVNAKKSKDKEQWEKGLSLHPVECALWGFNGGDTEWGNPYRAVLVDMMHQTDLV
ncbi:hypothetical protein KFL_006960010 [Klebsormidium nitens]|uniref:Uncharacterized protein n=1 Tax=Klebsormidium nitens TaxID=105231 RepID=A0A1Y1IJ23_KLENI|nr:hypothetical protein KFL_006960010 [Klebsormidium nitens]|eukprot:GAQ90875.1 hypothetical protein KFL_006960010 [Klebsormidium nitens]